MKFIQYDKIKEAVLNRTDQSTVLFLKVFYSEAESSSTIFIPDSDPKVVQQLYWKMYQPTITFQYLNTSCSNPVMNGTGTWRNGEMKCQNC